MDKTENIVQIVNAVAVPVPCGACVVCCQRDQTFIHRELGDDPDSYETVVVQKGDRKQLMLAHSRNGDCIYLDRKNACTIYDRRPAMCRELDCRLILNTTGKQRKQLIKDKVLNKKLLQAARDCLKRTKNITRGK